jgi:putative membrane protein
MSAVLDSVAAGLPVLLAHFGTTIAIFAAGLALYLAVTPYHELSLVRNGNVAAGISLAGAMVGLAVPLAATMAKSVNVPDILVWGVIAVALQLVTFGIVSALLRPLPHAIDRGQIAPALVLAAAQLSIGAINAAAMMG